MAGASSANGHAFISYVRVDSLAVDGLQQALEAVGVQVWRDTTSLWPGEDWRAKIRAAITGGALAFIACFSRQSLALGKSYRNEELTLAIEQMRLRQPGAPWLIPVRLDECIIPDLDLGGGRTLSSIQRVDLFGDHRGEALSRLVTAVLRILGLPEPDVEDEAGSKALIWRHSASQIQSARGTVGGSLYLTAGRLLFRPDSLEAAIGGQQWSARLSTVRSASIQLRGGNVLKGGLRDRLRIDLADGSSELFVVDRINEVIEVINEAVARHPGTLAPPGEKYDSYESARLYAWLSSGGGEPAPVLLPANWPIVRIADAATRWFRRFRSAADLSNLITAATDERADVAENDFLALRDILKDPATWSTASYPIEMLVEDISSGPATVTLVQGRAVVRAVLRCALAELDPDAFEQVLIAGLERMALSRGSRWDGSILDDIPTWLAARSKTADSVPEELLGRLAALLSAASASSAARADIAVYLACLINEMLGLVTLEPLVVSGHRVRIPTGASGLREVSADELVRRCRRLVILGRAWSGKTLLAASAALDSARAALTALGTGALLDEVELPLFTACSDLREVADGIRGAVVASVLGWLGRFGAGFANAVAEHLEERTAPTVLFLDALDEAGESADVAVRLIDSLPWRIVLTSRPSAWHDQLIIPPDNELYAVAELVPMRDHLSSVNELVDRFERSGEEAALEEARAILDRVLRVTGPSDPERAAYLTTQFWLAERLLDLAYLEQSVQNLRKAVQAAADDDPIRPRYLENLAHGLRLIGDATGDTEPLAESVAVLRQAVAAQATRNPERLCDLSQALLILLERTEQESYLGDAVTASREAADALKASGYSGLSWVPFVLQADSLRQMVDYTPIATTLLLWTLYMHPASTAHELIGSVLRPADAEAALAGLVGHEAVASLSAPELLPDLNPSANLRRVLAAAARATGRGEMITDRELLAGLVAVPECVATRWLVRTCGLPAERLKDVIRQSLRSEDPLVELVWRARTPTSYALRLELPTGQIGLGGVLDVFVRLDPTVSVDDAEDGYQLDAGSGSAELNLLLRAPGFRVEGDDAATLSLDPRDRVGSARFTQSTVFQLTALRSGRMAVTCSVFRGSDYETVLEGSVTITNEQAVAQVQPWMPARARAGPAADLTLEVRPEWPDGLSACTLVYRLTSSRPDLGLGDGLAFRSRSLAASWLDRVRSLLAAAITEITDTAAGDAAARLRSFGQYLGDLVMPDELRGELASLGRAHTLQVLADEDVWAPWELVHDGSAFLAERYVIGRWPRELAAACPSEVPLGPVSLAYYQAVDQPARWAVLLQPAGAPAASLLPGGVLRDVAATQTLPGLHIVRQTQPEDSGRRDSPMIAGRDSGSELAQIALAVRRERPVITLGYVRKEGVALAALEQTWAMGFLRARCSAFAGPMWAVDPAVDAAFTARFYEHLWAGAALGEAFRAARILARAVSPGSPDWLAYVLFADPMSRPYRPVEGSGYATVERVGAELDEPLHPGQTARFRASLRRAPPVWHEDRVLEVVSEFTFDALELHVLSSGVEAAPPGPIPLSRTPDGDYRAWFTLSAPSAPRDEPAFVALYFVDRLRPVHSLTFPVAISPAGGESG
jgi:hypothetical protein